MTFESSVSTAPAYHPLPRLTRAQAPLTCEVDTVNEFGEHQVVSIPAERALTVYVDKRELVTLMTLGEHPELLVLGYLLNQRLVRVAEHVESITVDWETAAAAARTRDGIDDMAEKTARWVVTTGCGQGSVFGGLMDAIEQVQLPAAAHMTQAQLYSLVNTIRLKETTYKSAGSVHACALFECASDEPRMLVFVEDVGRHNAIDTIAGWMAMNRLAVADTCNEQTSLIFYTTGRLTSEMVIKSAQMGVPIVVSRSGMTQMGHEVAQKLGLCAIGRATNKRFVCYTHPARIRFQPELAGVSPRHTAAQS